MHSVPFLYDLLYRSRCPVLISSKQIMKYIINNNNNKIELHRESSLIVTQSTSCAIATAMKLHCKCKISNCFIYFDKGMFCLYIKLQKESPFLFLDLRCAWDFGVSFSWIDSVWKSTLQWWQEELFTFSTKRKFSYRSKKSVSLKLLTQSLFTLAL